MWRYLMCILPTSSNLLPPARQTTLTNMRPILLLESVRSGTTSLTTCQSSSFICSDFTPKAKRLSRNWSHSHPSHCRYYQKPTWFARKYVYHDTQVLILLTPTLTELCRWHRRVSGFPLQMWLFTPEPWPGYVETQSSVFVTIEHPSWPNDIDIVRTQANVWCGHLCFSSWSATSTGQGWGRCGKEQGLKCQENNTNLNCLNYANQLC